MIKDDFGLGRSWSLKFVRNTAPDNQKVHAQARLAHILV